MANVKYQQTVDTSGKCCPLPMVETNSAINAMQPGQVLEIIATDQATRWDLPSWCERTGNTMLEHSEVDGTLRYYIRKGGTPSESD